MVPGHEIVGRVIEVGEHVEKFKAGDLAGVGCMVDSCRTCAACGEGLEQYCEKGFNGTYGAKSRIGDGITYGGYSNHIVGRSEEHTSELQSLMRISYAAFGLKKKNSQQKTTRNNYSNQSP